MTQHLSPQEFVEALDGALLAARRSHLESCDDCRDEVDHLRQLMSDVGATAGLPELSPLFWEHFSRRVRAATGDMVLAPQAWWRIGWRPLVPVGSVLAAVVLTVALQ